MSSTRVWVLAVVLVLAMGSSSCRIFRRSSKQTVPPVPQPASQPAEMKPAPAPQPPTQETVSTPPPELPPGAPNLEQQIPVEAPKLPPPPRKRTARIRRPDADPPKVAEPEPDLPVPQLEQILSSEQQQQYIQAIDGSIGRAQRSLASLNGRRLNAGQATSVERIKTFIAQALEARKTDLLRAKNLAERADVLAEDLLRSAQ